MSGILTPNNIDMKDQNTPTFNYKNSINDIKVSDSS